MKKEIKKNSDLWNGYSITEYSSLDLRWFIETGSPIISVQKGVVKKWLNKILQWIWVENIWKETLEENMWRAGFFSLKSKEFWEIGFLWTKWPSSTESFSGVSDYYLWWTDIWDKMQARGLGLEEIEKIFWEVIWWCKTELLLLLWREILKNMNLEWWIITDLELDILTTKFTPTLTQKVIKKLPIDMQELSINEVDSNSELNIQIQEILNPGCNVWAIEIVQSWKSLIATDAFVVSEWKIFEPSKRDENMVFEWNIIWVLDPMSKVGRIANWIQSNVDLALYNILSAKGDKPKEFIEALQNSMKNIK